MNLIENTDNIYASYGYSTGYPFMTLHCNRQGIYLVNDKNPGKVIILPGSLLYLCNHVCAQDHCGFWPSAVFLPPFTLFISWVVLFTS